MLYLFLTFDESVLNAYPSKYVNAIIDCNKLV